MYSATSLPWRIRHRVRQRIKGGVPLWQGVLIAGIVIGLVIVGYHWLPVVVPPPIWHGTEQYCNKHKLGCDLTTHLVGDGVVAFIGVLLYLYHQRRTASGWRRRAKSEPEQLFPWLGAPEAGLTATAARSVRRLRNLLRRRSTMVEGILGRDDLVREIADDLNLGSDPQVIVADSAAGKTMVLVKLADCLARRHEVPVVISLQQQKDLDFEALAAATFKADSPSHDHEALDKQWTRLRDSGQITVIADDLEKADAEPSEIEAALRLAGRRKLRLVCASRPYGLPPDFRRGRIELEPLSKREVEDDLTALLLKGSRNPRSRRQLGRDRARSIASGFVRSAELNETPYYLSLARVLADVGRLKAPEGNDKRKEPRLWLLDAYRDYLADPSVKRDGQLTGERRERVLKRLEPIAFVRLRGQRDEAELAVAAPALSGEAFDVAAELEAAERMGVIELDHGGRMRFAHPTTLAYFASRFLLDHGNDRHHWDRVINKQWGPFRALTLLFATVQTEDQDLTGHVCDRLLKRALSPAERGTDPRPAKAGWLTTAAEIARLAPGVSPDIAREVFESVKAELEASEPGQEHTNRRQTHGILSVTQRAEMLKMLGRLSVKFELSDGYELLWKYAWKNTDYTFQRQALRILADSRFPVQPIYGHVSSSIDEAARDWRPIDQPEPSDNDRADNLKAVARILPSLRRAAAEEIKNYTGSAAMDAAARSERLEDCQRVLVEHATDWEPQQRGLEASIAQGLKLEAVLRPGLRQDPHVSEMLRLVRPPKQSRRLRRRVPAARFWFSRVLLLQAVAIRCREHPDSAARRILIRGLWDEHVFVRRAARLCLYSLVAERPERFIFGDLMESASRTPYDLAPATAQLVGEIVLALNLNEYGTPATRRAFGNQSGLPRCMAKRAEATRILESNPEPATKCPFRPEGQNYGCLCPYTWDKPEQASLRRELSRAFCRHQRLNARRLPGTARSRSKRVREFWEAMEERAQF